MLSVLRLVAALVTAALGVGFAVVSLQIGDHTAGSAVMLIPWGNPPPVVVGAPWLGSSVFLALLIGVGIPVLLITAAVWLASRSVDFGRMPAKRLDDDDPEPEGA